MKFIYTVWLRDTSLRADDPDYEWPACFVVDAENQTSAKKWGDHLAHTYALTQAQQVVSSQTETLETAQLPGIEKLPVIQDGHEATNDEIGW